MSTYSWTLPASQIGGVGEYVLRCILFFDRHEKKDGRAQISYDM